MEVLIKCTFHGLLVTFKRESGVCFGIDGIEAHKVQRAFSMETD